jgi:hypothetical protein
MESVKEGEDRRKEKGEDGDVGVKGPQSFSLKFF